jgi:PAS domain S-box-containing protein
MMVSDGTVVGAVAVCLPQGTPLENRSVAETVIHIAALALQRQYTRESLRKSDSRFRTVTAVTPLPVSIISPDGRYLSVNSSFTELFGYTLDDIPDGRRWFLQAFPDTSLMQRARDLWLQDLRQSKPGEIRSRRFPVRCKDGSICSILFHPCTLPDGCQLVVYEDGTGSEEAERVRNLLAEIVRSSHDAIIGMTTNGRIQTWNPGAERVYGYTAGEMIGKDIALLFPPHLPGEKDRILAMVQSGKFIPELETERVRKDGAVIDVSVTISPVFDRDGTIIGVSTIVKDITAKKAAERFRELESRYRSRVDAINVGVYRSTGDPGGRFVWGNSSLVRILGYSSFEDVADIPVSDHFLHIGGRRELLDDLRHSGFVKNRELLLRKKDGSTLHVLVTALATFAPDGGIVFINGIVEDVTENRILARKLASLGELPDESGPSIP